MKIKVCFMFSHTTVSRDFFLREPCFYPELRVFVLLIWLSKIVTTNLINFSGAPSISLTLEKGRKAKSKYDSELLERIINGNNLNEAFRRVKANKGSHGTDGMKVDELLQYLKENGANLRRSLLEGSYKPNPVRKVEIPKHDGKERPLGIPTVVDRVI